MPLNKDSAQQVEAEDAIAHPRQRQRYTQPLKLDRVVRMVQEPTSSIPQVPPKTPPKTFPKNHCQGITFHLNSTTLSRVLLAQSRQQPLHITPDFLTNFRRYVLFDGQGGLQTGMNFQTYYSVGQQERALFETVISLDGDIIHKVSAECLQDERLAQDLSTAHYWLMRQLFQRLGLELQHWLDRFSWGCTVVTFSSYWASQWQQFIQAGGVEKLLELALTVGGAWLIQMGLQQVLQRLLPWIQRQVMRRLIITRGI